MSNAITGGPINVLVSCEDGTAIRSLLSENDIVNFGHVVGYVAIDLAGPASIAGGSDGSSIYNASTGQIVGKTDAIRANGSNINIVNEGSILALDGTAVSLYGAIDGQDISNAGHIYGSLNSFSIDNSDASQQLDILNTGLIEGRVLASLSATSNLNFQNNGTLDGGDFSIMTLLGGLYLKNTGLIDGNIATGVNSPGGTGHNCYVRNTGTISGNLRFAGNGNDTVDSRGGSVLGEIRSLSGNDLIRGGLSDDTIAGGLGRDTMNGFEGHDAFIFDTHLGPSNIDRIKGFSVGDDEIQLENSVFSVLTSPGYLVPKHFFVGAAAHDADDRIIYNQTTGALFYDADGIGAGKQTKFAMLDAGLSLVSGDFLVV